MDEEPARTGGPNYERRLREDRRWSWDEADRHFEGRSLVFQAMRALARRLGERDLPYAIYDELAMFRHGLRRVTDSFALLVGRDGFEAIRAEPGGFGVVPPFGGEPWRDAEHGVRIAFLVAGEYPGDRRPKPIAFPDPATVAVDLGGIKYVSLPALVELKLASGMTSPGRLKDLADVVELIKALDLPADFAEKLDPYVRGQFAEFWTGVHDGPGDP